MKLWNKDGDSRKNTMMLCLMAAGILEFLFITLERQFSFLGYYLTEDYLIVPALLFLGYALGGQLTKFARQRLLLAGAAVCWFVLVQIIHKLSGMDTHPIATVFFVYLMGFPFASVADDRDHSGIRWIGAMFLTASLVLVIYSAMLLLKLIPAAWEYFLDWDGARLHVFWHPNISACFFMLGIGFAAAFLVQSRKPLVKALLAAAIVLLFVAMALTNCRTTLLMTGALFGGIAFFLIAKGGWKRFALGLLAALVILVGTFKISGSIFKLNNDRLVAEYYASVQDPADDSPQEENITIQGETEVLTGANGQGTLANDMRTLNNRTKIWSAAFRAVRDSKVLALFGTEYSGTVISAYNDFEIVHGHNSWIEAMLRLGLPGLLMSLVFTALSVWSAVKLALDPAVELWKKIIAMLTVCVTAAGFLEPYLFITNVYYHVTDFAFFFLTGYLDYWRGSASATKHTP